jgi:hypothetical protein
MTEKKKSTPIIKNKNLVPFEQLTDAPSRMFRKIIIDLGINQAKWKTYLDDYLRWVHPDDSGDPIDVKRARSTALGNIQSTLFCSNSLTWNKFLMGLKILKITMADIDIKIMTESGVEYNVGEKTVLGKPPRGKSEE